MVEIELHRHEAHLHCCCPQCQVPHLQVTWPGQETEFIRPHVQRPQGCAEGSLELSMVIPRFASSVDQYGLQLRRNRHSSELTSYKPCSSLVKVWWAKPGVQQTTRTCFSREACGTCCKCRLLLRPQSDNTPQTKKVQNKGQTSETYMNFKNHQHACSICPQASALTPKRQNS